MAVATAPTKVRGQVPIAGAVEGTIKYEVVDGFFKRPRKWSFIEVADVDVDEDDNVYVFNRSAHPVMIFDKDGNFLDYWGEIGSGPYAFVYPHGISVGPDGCVYTADVENHSVRKWTKDGKLLMVLGRPFMPSPKDSGIPFNRPTHFTVASNGDYYVSDGYNNAHIHCYDHEGQFKFSFGGRGSGPGQFDTIHSLWIDREDGDKLYCADRYNNRVQFFSKEGKFLGQWENLLMANSVRKGRDGLFYVAELSNRVTVLQGDGTIVARWGHDGAHPVTGSETFAERKLTIDPRAEKDRDTYGPLPTAAAARMKLMSTKIIYEPGPGLFCAPHGISVDSKGSIYVAEVSESYSGLDRGQRAIQKFVRV
jgi:DNA-binding beta-propeller fold protein YncE